MRSHHPARGSRGVYRKHLFALLVAVAAAALGYAACGWWFLETRTPPVEVRQRAPSFALSDYQGREISLDSLLAKGPAVVVFYRGHW